MQYQLSCEQVSALLSFYVEDKLSSKLSKYVWEHLQNCPECMEKYQKIQSMLTKFIDIQNYELDNSYINKQYEKFKSNLSAYIDNELDDVENIKIKKIAISNPLARLDLENIYTFKKLLHSSFEKTKNELKTDYSKQILSKYTGAEHKNSEQFWKITLVFFAIIMFIIIGMVTILYF